MFRASRSRPACALRLIESSSMPGGLASQISTDCTVIAQSLVFASMIIVATAEAKARPMASPPRWRSHGQA
jgi:hypothetical protein